MEPWRILALPPLGADLLRGLVAPLGDAAVLSLPAQRTRAALQAALADAELVIGDFTGAGGLAMDAAAVAAAPHLAFVQMPQVGVDSCDLPALSAAGVPVANTAGANARAVTEWAVGAAFALTRRLAWADRRVRAGGWPQAELLGAAVREMHGLRVGVVGMGPIGREVASVFAALGCPVAYWSRREHPETAARYLPLDELLAGSDLVVVAVPLTPETTGLLDTARLALLPRRALLVNVARGGIVDEAALVTALDEERIDGAALDVFAAEPLPADSPLRSHEKILLSPHVAGATSQSQLAIVRIVVDNLGAAVRGEPVVNVVNGQSAKIHRRP